MVLIVPVVYFAETKSNMEVAVELLAVVVNGIALAVLVYQARLQRKELALQRKELRATQKQVAKQTEEFERQNQLEIERIEIDKFNNIINLYLRFIDNLGIEWAIVLEKDKSKWTTQEPGEGDSVAIVNTTGLACFATFDQSYTKCYKYFYNNSKEHPDAKASFAFSRSIMRLVDYYNNIFGSYFGMVRYICIAIERIDHPMGKEQMAAAFGSIMTGFEIMVLGSHHQYVTNGLVEEEKRIVEKWLFEIVQSQKGSLKLIKGPNLQQN